MGLEEAEGVSWNIAKANRGWLAEWVTLQSVGKPDSWITSQVKTDGFKIRQVDLPEEVPSVRLEGAGKKGTSGNTRPIEALGIADESVVVMNFEPMNPGNRREGKTQGTPVHTGDAVRSKVERWCEGRKENQSEMKSSGYATVEDNSH